MLINLDDTQDVFSHFVLEDSDFCMVVAETPQWKDEKKMVLTIQVNGVDLPLDQINSKLHSWYDNMCKKVREEISPEGFEKRVELEVQKRLQDRANDLIEQMDILREKLTSANDLIKPHWEE